MDHSRNSSSVEPFWKAHVRFGWIVIALLSLIGCEVLDDAVVTDATDSSDVDAGDSTNAADEYLPQQVSAARFDYSSKVEELFDSPWPSDERLTVDGRVDLSLYPQRDKVGLVDFYADSIEQDLRGFSVMPVVYIPLGGALGALPIPTELESARDESPVRLRRVLPDCGPAVPIDVAFQDKGTEYIPRTTLVAVPAIGHPLDPGATYALVLDGDWNGADGLPMYGPQSFFDRLLNAHPDGDSRHERGMAALLACESTAIEARSLRMATTFTVQNPAESTRAMRAQALNPSVVPSPVASDLKHLPGIGGDRWRAYQGAYETPIFMRGTSPYTKGGGIEYDDSGAPIVQNFETVPFIVSVPASVDGPVPVVVWVDGTGASNRSHLGDAWFERAIEAGFAIATFAPQFHDTRATEGSDEVFSTFNYVNPEAGRTVFRQQAVDTSFFVRVLKEAVPAVLADVAESVSLDTDTMVYGGHSQGGLVGVLVSAIEPEFRSFVFSGTGAYTSITVLERDDIFDIEQVVRGLFGLTEPLDRMHPLLQLVQMGADAVDPHSYMSAWDGWDANPAGVSVFVINGDEDATTHVDSVDHLAIATQLTPISPAGWVPARLPFDEIVAATVPIQATHESLDGTPNTRVTWLEGGGGHFTLYRRDDVPRLVADFWASSITGVPTIPVFVRDVE